ncbi:MAG: sulfotransferase domain-containing protein [Gammaproteobacteria bacterium]
MVFDDIRLTQTLAAILRPAKKSGVNSRSLAFIKLALRDKSDCVLFATFPKSGWNWTTDILSYALIKRLTGRYEIAYGERGTLKQRISVPYKLFHPADARAASARAIQVDFPKINVHLCLHTHGFWKQSPLWGLDHAKTVFVVRNIPTTLYSFYKSKSNRYSTFEEALADGLLDRIIRFYNSWGDFCALHDHYRIYRYEAFKSDPLPHFKAMIEYVFDLRVDDALILEALDYFSIENQKAREYRYCSDADKHFHFQGQADYRDRIAEETLRAIYAKIQAELRHPFGYVYPS